MAKSRISKNEKRRLQMKAKHAQGVEVSTRIRLMAEQIQNNAQLRTLLMQEADVDRRSLRLRRPVGYRANSRYSLIS